MFFGLVDGNFRYKMMMIIRGFSAGPIAQEENRKSQPFGGRGPVRSLACNFGLTS